MLIAVVWLWCLAYVHCMQEPPEGTTFSVQRARSLTDGPIGRTLLQFASPILGMNVLQYIGGTVNVFWVGRYLGEAALTAVVNAQSIMFLLTGAAFGIAGAATIMVGQCVGAGNVTEAKRVVGTGAILFLVLSALMSIAGVVLAKPLLIAMKTTGEALALAVTYTKVMFLALPILYLNLYVISILLGTGDSKSPLWFIVLSAVMVAVLSPLCMFGVGPLQGAGIAGSAFTILVSQAASLGALVAHLYRRRNPLCLYQEDLALLRVDWSVVGMLVRKGIPMGAQVVVVSFSAVLMIVLVNRFGVDTTAAYGASMQLWMYVQLPALSIAAAVSTMAAQSVGAQNMRRVRDVGRLGVMLCVIVTGLIILLVYAADSYAYRLFLPEGSGAFPIASHLNRVVLWSFMFLVAAMVLFGIVRATGAVMAPLFIHGLSLLGVRFPLALLLIDEWQADAIWWSFSISCAFDFLLAALYYRYGGWRAAAKLAMVARLRRATSKDSARTL
ncbi:MATE family efflux transporter [Steroidobacter agaridevorans]|uniref:MATE family efflux transporter n=1 Tax=Steroidobacter agaridevorans TaxID=2695856 RepID=A0A829YLI2_9GAMM|nr:MATE family efflux transporter [Steroidobacter agaridevorans]